jgi:hypothetical protein
MTGAVKRQPGTAAGLQSEILISKSKHYANESKSFLAFFEHVGQ